MHCALCKKEKKLCKSHIIPEFFYKPIYEENRYYTVSTDPAEENVKYQKGIWDRLLCENCETQFSKWENYVRKILYGGIDIDIVKQKGKIQIQNVDYSTFKLFQLALLWRAGVTKRREFKEINLGRHEEPLRKLILSNDPGKKYEYCCLMVVSPYLVRVLDSFIIAPTGSDCLSLYLYQL